MNELKGIKIYYNKDEKRFKYEDVLSKIESSDADDTFWWMADLESALDAVNHHNKHLDDVRICKDCGKAFFLPENERNWFEERELSLPKRCYKCRRKRKTQAKEG